MRGLAQIAGSLIASIIGIIVMVILATIVFFITTFVVSTGASLAGYDPSGDFVVIAAALIVVSVILTGGMTPRMTEQFVAATHPTTDDPTYD